VLSGAVSQHGASHALDFADRSAEIGATSKRRRLTRDSRQRKNNRLQVNEDLTEEIFETISDI
jgi:hypothetical protein